MDRLAGLQSRVREAERQVEVQRVLMELHVQALGAALGRLEAARAALQAEADVLAAERVSPMRGLRDLARRVPTQEVVEGAEERRRRTA